MASTSKLLFPDAAHISLRLERSDLKDTYNRVHSIDFDAQFVDTEVRRAFLDFPILANQRAGAWYVKPTTTTIPAYFKSTDGHSGEHSFSLRRANLTLVPHISQHKGIVLVDVTRRGKRYPDALSKTIPIWCAVINRARMKLRNSPVDKSSMEAVNWQAFSELYTLPSAVSRSEHAQIENRIEGWADELIASSYDLSDIKNLPSPLRPIFVSPASSLALIPASTFPQCFPVVCLSASMLAEDAKEMEREHGFVYVQGAGDDHELWSKGLSPAQFWKHSSEILAATRDTVDKVIDGIVSSGELSLDSLSLSPSLSREIRKTRVELEFDARIAPALPPTEGALLVNILLDSSKPPALPQSNILNLRARSGKAGHSAFFASLPSALVEVKTALLENRRILVRIESDKPSNDANDLGVALATVILFKFFDSDGVCNIDEGSALIATKAAIRHRIQWILEAFPSINPSRAILTRINGYLMSSN